MNPVLEHLKECPECRANGLSCPDGIAALLSVPTKDKLPVEVKPIEQEEQKNRWEKN